MKKIILFLLLIDLPVLEVSAQESKITCTKTTCEEEYIIDEDTSIINNIELNILKEDTSLLNEINTYKLKIINNSNKEFIYSKDSLKIYPITEYQEYDTSLLNIKIYRLSSSEPLKYLYDNNELKSSQLQDEILNKKLINLGYKGVEELDKYYLDYINKNYNEQYKSIEELDLTYIEKIWPPTSEYKIEESNLKLKKLYYNYIYNEGIELKIKDNITNISDNKLNEYLEYYIISPNQSTTYLTIELYPKLYLSNKMNLSISFDIIENTTLGRVNIYYIDTYGNYIKSPDVISKYIGEEYIVEEKNFPNYNLVRIDGNKTGIITSTPQDIFYMYDLTEQVNTGINKNYLPEILLIIIILLILETTII